MKSFFSIISATLCFVIPVVALPVGWINPEQGKFAVGLELGNIDEVKLQDKSGSTYELDGDFYFIKGCHPRQFGGYADSISTSNPVLRISSVFGSETK